MTPPPSAGGETRLAVAAGLSCFTIWGLVPLVFQAMGALGASPWEILAHRTFWAIPAAAVLVILARQQREVVTVLRTPRTLGWLALSALLIAGNWCVFIWAVNNGHVLETSLGYYINPLLNMAVGAAMFRERIDRIGWAAIALAAVGVAAQAVALGRLPWVSVFLALTFCAYGVVRKRVPAEAQSGLFVECLMLGLPGLIGLTWLQQSGEAAFLTGPAVTAWLVFCGPLTAIPLVLFSWSARRIPLSLLGFIQFVTPTMTFAIGVAQGEAFTPVRALSFGFIWAGVALFIWASLRAASLTRRELAETA